MDLVLLIGSTFPSLPPSSRYLSFLVSSVHSNPKTPPITFSLQENSSKPTSISVGIPSEKGLTDGFPTNNVFSGQTISSILGPNSWLWLGAILSSSFLIFMIIIGIISRYYIYPIDHNTNKIYSLTSKTIIYLLVISVSIMATSSAAMLWNKKKYGNVENKQVQNVDVPSPTSSPTSWGNSSLREIESTPQESLVQRTNLHFGERPNLKKLLLDVEGSSVGVLVCGPKKMRQKVAEICSSGLAENLHFESISFSW